MNRILVLYDSRTGNVAQMAKLVAEGAASIPQSELRVLSVDDAKAEDVPNDSPFGWVSEIPFDRGHREKHLA
jgi:flavodoxin